MNGKEMDGEIKGEGNSYDFGARMLDPRIGRWGSMDPLTSDYPYASPYNFALNTPIQAIDPDGRLIILVNGLMLHHALASDNRREINYGSDPKYRLMGPNPKYAPYPTHEMSTGEFPTYLGEEFSYWNGIDAEFSAKWKDPNLLYVDGSNHTWSEGADRFKAGQQSGYELIAKIQSGEIKLTKDETIKLVAHSQGTAHAAGMATVLEEAYNIGTIKNKVEQIAYLASQEPKEFKTPPGIFSVQYSRMSDLVASKGIVSKKPISGGSEYGPIEGITEFIPMPNLTGKGNGIFGTRGGHDVGTYSSIFDISQDKPGGVTKDVPTKSRYPEIGPRNENGSF